MSVVDRMDNMDKIYGVDRKEASKILNVSVRTVDRYIKQGKLSIQNERGRVWLNKEELEAFHHRGISRHRVDISSADRLNNSDQRQVITGKTPMSTQVDSIDTMSTLLSTLKQQHSTYKKLYEELSTEIRTQQKRLEAANYRVGQLEARLETSVPLLEITNERNNHSQQTKLLSEQVQLCQNNLETTQKLLKSEKALKAVYFSILIIILILQPLWIWLSVIE